MPPELSTMLGAVSVVISLCLAIGGIFAWRAGFSKQASLIQREVIDAQSAQLESQERQIKSCEKEIARLKRVVSTIQIALKRRGLTIEIDGDSITLLDNQGRSTRTMQINITDEHETVPNGEP